MAVAMDEEQYIQRFAMDADFDNGRWIDGEFYYHSHKEREPPQTRDNTIYGIFSNLDSDSDASRSSRKRHRSSAPAGKPNLTKQVSFISLRTVMPNQEIDRAAAEEREQ